MAALDPADRRVIARIAINERWAGEEDRAAATAAARANGPGSIEYWIRKVDPDGLLARDVVLPMAQKRKTAFYERLARSGRKAKAAKAAATRGGR